MKPEDENGKPQTSERPCAAPYARLRCQAIRQVWYCSGSRTLIIHRP